MILESHNDKGKNHKPHSNQPTKGEEAKFQLKEENSPEEIKGKLGKVDNKFSGFEIFFGRSFGF